ncbi:MAG: LPS export ABC transporter periplasmic protein LptC [Melioribacteraceae bacterium]|nr:LPS export ABC transporter periplasmic protein LptC [Melioribacteraceae bacterium]MCF8355106.1 LPS export ABC transporter periplasmic protein LptC [Melioribacteraceae bacterium]MCF8392417.1 LPS export ABC transporter periplasmic protein LptC [Melioribacteraceae bacterium]MCF8417938.1 LPS export ABC transporter periplasmic protein LptC [Melioribacteraceae bacterium]
MKHLIIILFSTLLILSCGDEKIKPKIDAEINEEGRPVQESWNAEIYFTENGTLQAILYSDHLMVYDKKKMKVLEGVRIDFYNPDGEITSTLTSKKGRVEDNTRNMYAIDSVVVVNDEGRTLRTDELMWRNKDRKITTEKFVTIVDEKERIEGFGFESDQNLQNYIIFNSTYSTKIEEEK